MHRIATRLLTALAWLMAMSLLAGWADTTAAGETAVALTLAAGVLLGAPDWQRHDRGLRPTLGRRARGTAVGLLAALSTVAGLVELLYALIFANGYEHIPSTTAELIPWLMIPPLAITAGSLALREGYRYLTSSWRPKRYLTAVLLAVLATLAWYCLATMLTQ